MPQRAVRYNHGFSEKWVLYLSPAEWRGRVRVEFVDVPLSRVEHAGSWTDPEVVGGWMRTLESGCPIPPPVAVLTERGTYYLHDGNHRLEALKEFLSNQSDPNIRVAIAVPVAGFEFVHRAFPAYATYVLRECPRRFATVAQAVVALTVSTLALAMTSWLRTVDETPLYTLFVLCVMIAAWVGGWKAGLLATVLNCLGAAYFLLPPNGSLMIAREAQAVHFAITALVMLVVPFFVEAVRRHPSVGLGIRIATSYRATRGPNLT